MEEPIINILLIEDNPDDVELIKRRICRSATAKFMITVATNLCDGLAKLEQESPDVIISDLGLPDSHGLDTVSKILTKKPQTPLVVLSGFDDETTAIKAVKAGAQDYLVKGQMEGTYIERSLFYAIERARMQRELREHSQEIQSIQTNLLKILEKNADAILVVGEDGKILFTNPAVETLLGKSQTALINCPFNYPLNGGKTTEIEIKRPDKAFTIAEMRVVDITWEGSTAFLASLRNITERRKMEEAVRASEKNLRMYLESAPDGIYISDLKGTFLYGNEKAEEIIGFTREELIGKNYLELGILVKKYFPKAIRLLGINMQKKPTGPDDFELIKKNGQRVWVEITTTPISQEGKLCVLGFVRDVTERKHEQEALRESEEKFSKAFRSSPESIVIAKCSDGTIMEANDAFFQNTGYKREEVLKVKRMNAKGWVDPIDRKKMVKTLKEKGVIRNEEYHFRNKSGEERTKLLSAELINFENEACILSITTDITERKKMEETLRFSDTAFKSIRESVIAIDNEYRITYWNKHSEEVFGSKAEDTLGKKLGEVIRPTEDYPGQSLERIRILKENGYSRNELHYVTKHGELWMDSTVQTMKEGDKKYGYVLTATDITERKKMEETLRFSDTAFKSIRESIIAVDNNHFITYWNNYSEELYGIKADEASGKYLMDVIKPIEEYPGQRIERTRKLKDTGYSHNELLYNTKRGDIWLDTTVQIMKDGEKPFGYVLTSTDITERKKAEAALRESEEKFSKAFHSSPQVIVISRLSDGLILETNDTFFHITGYSPEEVIGRNSYEMGIWAYPEEHNKMRQILKNDGTVRNKEYTFRIKSGELRTWLFSAEIANIKNEVCMLSVTTDITERKKTEEKLRKSEERYRDLFENASDLIQSVNADGHFTYVNSAWLKALGYTKAETAHLVIWNIVHSNNIDECRETFKKVMSGEKVTSLEAMYVAKDGHIINVEGNINGVIENGKVIATRGIFRDITERKEAEEKLRQVDQMKSEFLSNVSHELRTPLQSIGGFTKLLMNGQVPDPTDQKEFLQIIDREALHLGNLINSLLDMSRLEAGRFQINPKLTNIKDYLIDPIKSFYSLARDKNIKLNEIIPEQLPEMEVDGERLRQVITNLLGNAIKFSDPGGSVTVKVEKQQDNLLFQISDQGIGISEDALKHLFERFYRAEGEMVRGGTGLGLYISRQIIEAHGGHIWADSKLGEGSTFTFILPLNSKGGKGNVKKNTCN